MSILIKLFDKMWPYYQIQSTDWLPTFLQPTRCLNNEDVYNHEFTTAAYSEHNI